MIKVAHKWNIGESFTDGTARAWLLQLLKHFPAGHEMKKPRDQNPIPRIIAIPHYPFVYAPCYG
jgi:hypothetical protein